MDVLIPLIAILPLYLKSLNASVVQVGLFFTLTQIIPLALLCFPSRNGVLVIVLVYLTVNAAYLYVLPLAEIPGAILRYVRVRPALPALREGETAGDDVMPVGDPGGRPAGRRQDHAWQAGAAQVPHPHPGCDKECGGGRAALHP